MLTYAKCFHWLEDDLSPHKWKDSREKLLLKFLMKCVRRLLIVLTNTWSLKVKAVKSLEGRALKRKNEDLPSSVSGQSSQATRITLIRQKAQRCDLDGAIGNVKSLLKMYINWICKKSTGTRTYYAFSTWKQIHEKLLYKSIVWFHKIPLRRQLQHLFLAFVTPLKLCSVWEF
jgi:hypothetical protein